MLTCVDLKHQLSLVEKKVEDKESENKKLAASESSLRDSLDLAR